MRRWEPTPPVALFPMDLGARTDTETLTDIIRDADEFSAHRCTSTCVNSLLAWWACSVLLAGAVLLCCYHQICN